MVGYLFPPHGRGNPVRQQFRQKDLLYLHLALIPQQRNPQPDQQEICLISNGFD